MAIVVHILYVHVQIIAAVERTRANVAHEEAWHRRVHGPAMPSQIGVFREFRVALVALEVSFLAGTRS